MPPLQGSGSLRRDANYWHSPHDHPGSAAPYSAVREGDWKLIEFFEDHHIEPYNLKNDVREQYNLAAKSPEKAALLAKLVAWRASVAAQLPIENPNYNPQTPVRRPAAPGWKEEGTAGLIDLPRCCGLRDARLLDTGRTKPDNTL